MEKNLDNRTIIQKQHHSSTTGRDAKWYRHSGNELTFAFKIKPAATLRSIFPREIKTVFTRTNADGALFVPAKMRTQPRRPSSGAWLTCAQPVSAPRGRLATSGDKCRPDRACSWHREGGARDAAQHPPVPRAAPPRRDPGEGARVPPRKLVPFPAKSLIGSQPGVRLWFHELLGTLDGHNQRSATGGKWAKRRSAGPPRTT